MKKIGLIVILVTVSAGIFAQRPDIRKLHKLSRTVKELTKNTREGNVFWSDDFSDKTKWIISNDEGNTENWRITTYSAMGNYTNGLKLESPTVSNKYALFDSDFMGDGVNKHRAKLSVKNGIDCSAYNTVFVKFYSLYARLESKVFFRVSNNNGASWTDYEVHSDMIDWTLSQNPTIINLDISEVAAGHENVLIQFYFDGQQTNKGLAWMVDDVSLYEPQGTEAEILSINNHWILGTTDVFNFSATLRNMGAETIETITFKYMVNGDESVEETISDLNIKPFETIELKHSDAYLFTSEGAYVPYLELVSINGNEHPILVQGDNMEVYDTENKEAILAELFTSSSCGPCAGFGSFYDEIENLVSPTLFNTIKYQMNWPSSGDPYYTQEGNARKNFYGVASAPSLYMHGEYMDIYEFGLNAIRNRLKQDAKLNLKASGTVNEETNMVDVTVDISPLTDVSGAYLFVSVNEKVTHNNATTNGETEFTHVMLKMLTGAEGEALGDLVADEALSFSYEYDMTSTFMEEINDLEVVVFVQDKTTKEMLQSETIDLSWEVETPTGIDARELMSGIKVYPNPTNGTFTVSNVEKGAVYVYNIIGNLIYSDHNYVAGKEINIYAYTRGTYIVRIATQNNSEMHKIILSK